MTFEKLDLYTLEWIAEKVSNMIMNNYERYNESLDINPVGKGIDRTLRDLMYILSSCIEHHKHS